jgi:hypothetical protein
MQKYIGFGLLALLLIATLWFAVGSLTQAPHAQVAGSGASEAAELKDDEGGAGKAPVVKREEGLHAETAGADAASLALPASCRPSRTARWNWKAMSRKPTRRRLWRRCFRRFATAIRSFASARRRPAVGC